MQLPRWEHFAHVADIGVRGFGATQADAFAQAALALNALIVDLDMVESRQAVAIDCTEADPELLLVDWLNAVVYEIATRCMVFGAFTVRIRDGHLQATAWGEPLVPVKHHPAVEVKGVTYTELRVGRTDGGWLAQCVVDV